MKNCITLAILLAAYAAGILATPVPEHSAISKRADDNTIAVPRLRGGKGGNGRKGGAGGAGGSVNRTGGSANGIGGKANGGGGSANGEGGTVGNNGSVSSNGVNGGV
ncbi:hypothetical protein BDZ97DRAFT_1813096, partial [Flammula alnicola]